MCDGPGWSIHIHLGTGIYVMLPILLSFSLRDMYYILTHYQNFVLQIYLQDSVEFILYSIDIHTHMQTGTY